MTLEDTARYASLLLAPVEALAEAEAFLPFGQKKPYYAVLASFWFLVVTLVTFSSKFSNFEGNP